jgi:hypothetical protein
MTFKVRSSEDASKALSYFNHFHDGFVQSILINVIPESRDGFGFALPVRHDITLGLVHSNYAAAEASGGRLQRIEIRLGRVMEMRIGNVIPLDNMLQECLIDVDANGGIHLDVGGDGLITFVSDALTIEEMEKRAWSRDRE